MDQDSGAQGGMLLLLLYAAFEALGVYLDYLAGLRVEAAYGSQVSLIFFLLMFALVLILAFPAAAYVAGLAFRKRPGAA